MRKLNAENSINRCIHTGGVQAREQSPTTGTGTGTHTKYILISGHRMHNCKLQNHAFPRTIPTLRRLHHVPYSRATIAFRKTVFAFVMHFFSRT